MIMAIGVCLRIIIFHIPILISLPYNEVEWKNIVLQDKLPGSLELRNLKTLYT